MEETYFISVEECCSHYNIETAFIDSLEAHGLLHPTVKDKHRYIEHDYLQKLERFINMHYEMDINMEGMEVITRLLDRLEEMQEEMRRMRGMMSA